MSLMRRGTSRPPTALPSFRVRNPLRNRCKLCAPTRYVSIGLRTLSDTTAESQKKGGSEMKFRHYFCAGMITAFSVAVFACGDPSSGAEAEDQAPILLEDLPARIGGERPAKVHWPKAVEANKAYPVVMLLHGYSVNGFLQNIVVESVERVQKFGYVLIVPEGRKNGRSEERRVGKERGSGIRRDQ